MADPKEKPPSTPEDAPATPALEKGTYEILLNRLSKHETDLRERLLKLNEARKQAFGSVEFELQRSERVTTHNNCVPRDMVPFNDAGLFRRIIDA